MVWTNGDSYKGNWENDHVNGYGVYKYDSGDIYKGNYKDGEMNGYGEYFYKNGDIYKGNWLNDQKVDENATIFLSRTGK